MGARASTHIFYLHCIQFDKCNSVAKTWYTNTHTHTKAKLWWLQEIMHCTFSIERVSVCLFFFPRCLLAQITHFNQEWIARIERDIKVVDWIQNSGRFLRGSVHILFYVCDVTQNILSSIVSFYCYSLEIGNLMSNETFTSI